MLRHCQPIYLQFTNDQKVWTLSETLSQGQWSEHGSGHLELLEIDAGPFRLLCIYTVTLKTVLICEENIHNITLREYVVVLLSVNGVQGAHVDVIGDCNIKWHAHTSTQQ